MRRMFALAGAATLATMANALPFAYDAKITIDRALNSPTLTVRYSGANAALVELRVNGESIGTRAVSASKTNGETNFNLNLSELKDGDNEVEVRVFDRTGKLVGTEKSNISTDQTQYGPVFLETPKVGQSLMGPVEIKLGFGRELRNVYVSFFVDNNFKKMSNYPPYTFMWDTTGEANGWHEIEAWVIDESSATYKTRKTRVFVNNPGGRTDRKGVTVETTTSKNPVRATLDGGEAGLRDLKVSSNGKAVGANTKTVSPRESTVEALNKVKGNVVGGASDIKPSTSTSALAMGVKNLTPSGQRTAVAAKPAETAPVKSVTTQPVAPVKTVVATNKVVAPTQGTVIKNVAAAAPSLLALTPGQRVPNLASFAVVFNSQYVNFDVNPRVEDGVPMAPFRHLIEKSGGTINWENLTKTVTANADGRNIQIQIGDPTAKLDDLAITLDYTPYLDRGRTIVPLSFLGQALKVTVEYDKETGHVLISQKK